MDIVSTALPTEKATTLESVFDVLQTSPLSTQAEIDAFYRDMSDVRGPSVVGLLEQSLRRSIGKSPFKVFLMGASGVGKSTELRKLSISLRSTHIPVWLDARSDIDRTRFSPYHIILVIANAIWKELVQLGLQGEVSTSTITKIAEWYYTESVKTTAVIEAKAVIEGGVGAKEESFFSKITGFFASVRGEASVARNTSREVEERRMSTLAELIDAANSFFQDATIALRDKREMEWLVLFESFDKQDVSIASNIELFLNNPALFELLRLNAIFTIPRSITYSSGSARLPMMSRKEVIITETPVFDKSYKPYEVGRDAIRKILGKRLELSLIDPEVLERFITASGGDLRRLFTMVTESADLAIYLSKQNDHIEKPRITHDAAEDTLNRHRLEFKNALAVLYGHEEITVRDKIDKLVSLYRREPISENPDHILAELIDSRAVQEYNGTFWLGVAPLMVDELNRLGALGSDGNYPGGTR